jgi:hypothetical protein
VVRVHEVEALAGIAAAQLARGGRPPRAPTRLDDEDLDLEPVEPAQGLDLVAHEAAETRPVRRRVHAGHEQHPHRRPAYPQRQRRGRLHVHARLCHLPVAKSSRRGLVP